MAREDFPRIFVIFQLCLTAAVTGFQPQVLQQCCDVGRQWYADNRGECPPHPTADSNSDSPGACSLVVGVCCLALGRSQRCVEGRQAALEGQSCFSAPEELRECCSCCALGSMAAHAGLPCQIPDHFSSGCRDSFLQCCRDRPRAPLVAHTPVVDGTKSDLTTSHPQNPKANRCDDQRCDHFCRTRDDRSECYCRQGFKLSTDGRTCADVDECSTGQHRCTTTTTVCVNTKGGYDCIVPLTTRRPFPVTAGRAMYHLLSTANGMVDSALQVRTRSRSSSRGRRQTAAPSPQSGTQEGCGPGYRMREDGSCDDVDECVTDDAACRLPNMVCRNTVGSFVCTCAPGYQFNPRRKMCEDIDECRTRRNDCTREEVCENSIGSFTCRSAGGSCSRGYALDPGTGRCKDVDECVDPDRCFSESLCINIPGSFRCEAVTCAKGTRLDGEGKCSDVDECRENPSTCGPGQACQNTPGSYLCRSSISCGAGYEMNSQGTKCEDVDECQSGRHSCHATLMTCVNRPGTYACQCPDGYQTNHATHSCDDIDECRKFGGHVCALNSNCENTPGSFRCNCQQGFRLESHSKFCSDINECLEPGICQHSCRNTWGSYYCLCNDGYQLSRDGRTCSDIDECGLWRESGRSSDACHGLCHNILGSYLCSCPTGYQMSSDGRQCQDVDECNAGLANCYDPDEVCLNTGGAFECRRIVCPRGFVKAPKMSDERPQQTTRSGSVPLENRVVPRQNRYGYGQDAVPLQTSTRSPFGPFRPFSSNALRGVVAQPILFLSNEDSGIVCQKVECAANDIPCVLNLTKSIQWQHLSLPSVAFLPDPVTIVTVQAIAGSVQQPNNEFAVVSGNDGGHFDVVMTPGFRDRGSVRLVKPLEGPSEHTLTLRMDNYNRYRNLISQHVAHIVISVSKYRF